MNNYFYLDESGQQRGPISPMQFNVYGINSHTMVWCNGMSDWLQAGDIPELNEFVNVGGGGFSAPPTPPHATANNNTYGRQAPLGVCPDTNLVWGILCTIFCCLPLGIVSIVYACKVENLFYAGNVAEAIDASQKARKWAIYGAVSTAVIYVIGIIIYIAFFAALMQGFLR